MKKKKKNTYTINFVNDLLNAVAAGDSRNVKIILFDLKCGGLRAVVNIF